MTEAECIDCGQWSETLLPARFPHICRRCLFPSQDASALLADLSRVVHTRSATGWTEQRL